MSDDEAVRRGEATDRAIAAQASHIREAVVKHDPQNDLEMKIGDYIWDHNDQGAYITAREVIRMVLEAS